MNQKEHKQLFLVSGMTCGHCKAAVQHFTHSHCHRTAQTHDRPQPLPDRGRPGNESLELLCRHERIAIKVLAVIDASSRIDRAARNMETFFRKFAYHVDVEVEHYYARRLRVH